MRTSVIDRPAPISVDEFLRAYPHERPTESLSALLARTAHLVPEDLGEVRCEECGSKRSIGRRTGDPLFVCLDGYGCQAHLPRASEGRR